MRFLGFEDWLDSWRWYHWLLVLALLSGLAYTADRQGWIATPPPGGWNPPAAPAPQR